MKKQFSTLDGLLCLALAAHLHASPEKLRWVARRVARRLPKSQRGMCAIVEMAPNPKLAINLIVKELTYETESPRCD